MLILTLLLTLLSSANIVTDQNDKLELQGPYILPRYPEKSLHSRIAGLFDVKVTVSKGKVDSVEIGSHDLGSLRSIRPAGIITTREALPEFMETIEEALGKWKFGNMQSGSLNLAIWFIPGSLVQEDEKENNHQIIDSDKLPYTSYIIEELPNNLPKRIIVETSLMNSANSGQNDKLELQGSYILPRYPKRVLHSWKIGLYTMKVTVSKGNVDSIQKLSQQTLRTIQGRTTSAEIIAPGVILSEFREAIEEALINWKFNDTQFDNFNVRISFIPVPLFKENEKEPYTSYRIEGLLNNPPTNIIVKTHQPFEEARK